MSLESGTSPKADKNQRYDRQIRLWGETGQRALEKANICLINANVVGTEILKSLVLPGLRAFTIVDDRKVTEDDCDNNFFLCTENALGQSRSKVALQNLMEMNEDVQNGQALEESFETLLEQNENFFQQFSLVIGCGIESSRSIQKLSKNLWDSDIPLLLVKSVGFFGYVRLQVREHCIIEAKTEDYLEDFRIDDPFPELQEYFTKYHEFNEMTRAELIKLPSVVIIYWALVRWAFKEKRETPKNRQDKDKIRVLIRENMHQLNDDNPTLIHFENDGEVHDQQILSADMENFIEADKFVNKAFANAHAVSGQLQKLLDEIPILDSLPIERKYSNFWFMMSTLKKFVSTFKCVPLSGTIGDMNCGSEHYIALLNIYKKKAQDDVNTMLKMMQEYCDSTGTTYQVSEEEVQLFCKNANHVTVIRTSPIYEELEQRSSKLVKTALETLQNGPEGNNELNIYMALKLAERLFTKQAHHAGQFEVDSDILELKRELRELNSSLQCSITLKDEIIEELCRYGGCELHSVSAFIGASAAHEAIKLITRQYVPVESTFVYNGTVASSEVFEF